MWLASWLVVALAQGPADLPGICPLGFVLDESRVCARWVPWAAREDVGSVMVAAAGPSGTFLASDRGVYRRSSSGTWVRESPVVAVGLVALGDGVAAWTSEGAFWLRMGDAWISGPDVPVEARSLHGVALDDVTLVLGSGWSWTRSGGWRPPPRRARLREPVTQVVRVTQGQVVLAGVSELVWLGEGRSRREALPSRGATVVAVNGALWASGGRARSGEVTSAVWERVGRNWQPRTAMMVARVGHALVSLGAGRLLAVGKDPHRAEVLDVASGQWSLAIRPPEQLITPRALAWGGVAVLWEGGTAWAFERIGGAAPAALVVPDPLDWEALERRARAEP